jgi:hypothetical protein
MNTKAAPARDPPPQPFNPLPRLPRRLLPRPLHRRRGRRARLCQAVHRLPINGQQQVPGLHASVARFSQRPAADIVCRIRAGGCLKQAFPSRSFGLQEHDSDAPHRQQAAMMRRLDSAVAACNAGDTLHLFHLVGHMQETQNGGWAHYDAFKEAFDRRYGSP